MNPITAHHLLNLQTGKYRENKEDGSIETVRTIQIDINGVPTLIPTIWDGKQLKDKAAKKRAMEWSIENNTMWPTASSHEELRKFDVEIHKSFDQDLRYYDIKGPLSRGDK